MITFKNFDEETYILNGDDLIGRIIEVEGGYNLVWENDLNKIPFYTLEDAKQYASENYF